MRKISAMYQWSGGTDYRHTCYECRNCIKVDKKRSIYKCRSYGITGSSATDWRASYIACKAFNQDPPEVPIFEIKMAAVKELPEGQMSLFDFMEG